MKISSSHIRSCLSALAFFSTSLGAAAPPPPAERALELELALAATPELYLVVDVGARRLEVKSRGLVLDAVELADATLTLYSPFGSGEPSSASQLPVVREVIEPNPGTTRKVVTVKTLTPYPEEEDAEETPAAATSHSPKHEDPQPAARYSSRLEGGWQVRVDTARTRPAVGERVGRLIVDGGRRLLGKPLSDSVILGLAMSADDARRLHHLFDEGLPLLVR